MRKAFYLILTLISLQVLGLPGDSERSIRNEPDLINVCQVQDLETISEFSLASLGNLTGCGSFTREQSVEYCDCMSTMFGNEIEKNPAYDEFVTKLNQFDRQETQIGEFIEKPETQILATLANFLSSASPDSVGPFDDGGVCSVRFKAAEEQMNIVSGVEQDLSALSGSLRNHKDYNFLVSENLSSPELQRRLQKFWTVKATEEGNTIIHEKNYGPEAKALNLLSQSINSLAATSAEFIQGYGPAISTLQPGDSLSIDKETVVSGICENLAKRFESERSSEKVITPGAGLFDVSSYTSEKWLTPADLGAFRGLRDRFQQKSIHAHEGQELFFGQLMCSNLDEKSFGEIEGSDEEEFKALSNEQLAQEIKKNNALILVTLEEHEAASLEAQYFQETAAALRDVLKSSLSEVGLTYEAFRELYKNLDSGSSMEALIDTLFVGRSLSAEVRQRMISEASDLHRLDLEYDKASVYQSVFEEKMALAHQSNDQASRELAFRLGSVTAARDFIGSEEVMSASQRYFSRFESHPSATFGPHQADSDLFSRDSRDGVNIGDSIARGEARLNQAMAVLDELGSDATMNAEDRANHTRVVESIRNSRQSRRRVGSFISGGSSYARPTSSYSALSSPFSSSTASSNTTPSIFSLPSSPVNDVAAEPANTPFRGVASTGDSEENLSRVSPTAAVRVTTPTDYETTNRLSSRLGNNANRSLNPIGSGQNSFSRDDSSEVVNSKVNAKIDSLNDRIAKKIAKVEERSASTPIGTSSKLGELKKELDSLKNQNDQLGERVRRRSAERAASSAAAGSSSTKASVTPTPINSSRAVASVSEDAAGVPAVASASRPSSSTSTGGRAFEPARTSVRGALEVNSQNGITGIQLTLISGSLGFGLSLKYKSAIPPLLLPFTASFLI
jgi:hypothetical protein